MGKDTKISKKNSNRLSNDKICGNNNLVQNIINYQEDPKYLLDLLKSNKEQASLEKELFKRKLEAENYLLHTHIQALNSDNELLTSQVTALQKLLFEKNKYISQLLKDRQVAC